MHRFRFFVLDQDKQPAYEIRVNEAVLAQSIELEHSLRLVMPYTQQVKSAGLPGLAIRVRDEESDNEQDFIVRRYSLTRSGRIATLNLECVHEDIDLLRRTALFLDGKPAASYKTGYALPHLDSAITLPELLTAIMQPAVAEHGFALELCDEAENDKRMLDISFNFTNILDALRQTLQRWSNAEKRYYAVVGNRTVQVKCKIYPDSNDPTSGLRLIYPDRHISAIAIENVDYERIANVIIPFGTERYADYRGLLLGSVASGPEQDAEGNWITPPSNFFEPETGDSPERNMLKVLNPGDEIMILKHVARNCSIVAAGSNWIQVSPPPGVKLPIGYRNSVVVITSGPAYGTAKLIVNYDENGKTIYVDSAWEIDDPAGALVGETCDVLIDPIFATVIGGDYRTFRANSGIAAAEGDYWGGKDRLLVEPYDWVHYGEDGSNPPNQTFCNGLLVLDTPSQELAYARGTSRRIIIDKYEPTEEWMVVTMDRGFDESPNGTDDATGARFIALAPINTFWDFPLTQFDYSLGTDSVTLWPKSGFEMPFGNIEPVINDADFCTDAMLTVIDGSNEGQHSKVTSVSYSGAPDYQLTIHVDQVPALAGDETLRLTFRCRSGRIFFQPRVEGPRESTIGWPSTGDVVYLLSAYQADGVPLTLGKLMLEEENGVRYLWRFPVYWATKRRIAVKDNMFIFDSDYPRLPISPGTVIFIGAYDVGEHNRIGFNIVKTSFNTIGQVAVVESVASPDELGTDYWLLELDRDLDPVPVRGVWCEVLSIQDVESIEKYGRRELVVEFRDITSPVLLKKEAQRYLDAFKEPQARYRISLHELAQLKGVTYDDYNLDIGETIALKDTLLGIDRNDLLITSLQRDLLNPWRVELTVETPASYLNRTAPLEQVVKNIKRELDQFRRPVKIIPEPKESGVQVPSGKSVRKPHEKPEIDAWTYEKSDRILITGVCNPLYRDGTRVSPNPNLGEATNPSDSEVLLVDITQCKIELPDLPDGIVDRITTDMISLEVYVSYAGSYISQYAGYSPPGDAEEQMAGIKAVVFTDPDPVPGRPEAEYVAEKITVSNLDRTPSTETLRVKRGKGFIIGLDVPQWDYENNDPDDQPIFNVVVYWTLRIQAWRWRE